MADVGEDEGTGDGKHNKKHDLFGKDAMPIHKEISDVGQFSYAALCASALRTLFETEANKKFREEVLAIILISIEQPQQVCESVRAMLLGHGVDDMDPYIDILLAEEALKDGADPLISELLAIAISQGCYDARMRVLIKHICWRLRVSWETLEDIESDLSDSLAFAQYEMSEEEKQEKAKKEKRRTLKRYALIGLATVGGGTLIGLTGGLAAPLVAAGAGAIIGGASAAVLGSTAGVALIGSLFGVAGAGLTGYKMKRRVGAVEEFEFEPLVCGNVLRADDMTSQLHITIALTGWLSNNMRDFKQPWKCLAESKEQYVLRYETKYLVQLGDALDYIFNSAMAMATQEALKFTVLRGLLAAIAWPSALLSAASIIDNPWSVALQRASAAGKLMADVLLSREQGKRPVTLIGYSLGARVIFSCLSELSNRKGCEGLIEDVVLLGAPVTGDPEAWSAFGKVVAGKIVNGFCRGDWLLKFLYRTSSVQMNIAGLRPIKWDDRRMHNIDLSDVVNGHMDYMKQLDTIMKAVGVRTRDEVQKSPFSLSRGSTNQSDGTRDFSMGDLSSSDEDWNDEPSEQEAVNPESVVLEDYTGNRSRSTTMEDTDQGVVPKSVSVDSGVDISKSNFGAGMSDSGTSLRGTRQGSVDKESLVAVGYLPDNYFVDEESDTEGGERVQGYAAARSQESGSDAGSATGYGQDRIGDAGAESNSDMDSGDNSKTAEQDDREEGVVDVVSPLQRKKMFDSMYRLVLDDDLEEIMQEVEEEDEETKTA